ncbi:MAG: undecaprenyldiphospho-muramoylpentapeptide beta-N-acetylglucosaminyltransferase [Clostridia bacterium]|nr:undecaprenyldiphospho-muramoylpentapeptide beta-N-acetylglucosaminyltransferase [Clostridia bacterium]
MRILLSGGGTAGHINPAVAVAKYAMEADKDTRVLFVGTKKGLESSLVPAEGFDIKYVNVSGLKKELSVSSAISAFKMGTALIKTIAIMKKFKPDIVVGTGGYVCVSSVMAAKLLGIPAIIHEQNVFPGSAVKFLADKCSITAISFDESRKYLKNAGNILLTGNPIRPAILEHNFEECKKKLGVCGKKVILCFGGSLGAARINDVMTDFLHKYPLSDDTVLYFGTGKREYDRVVNLFESKNISLKDNIKLLPYIDNMDILMNAADVLICRSGAITLAELCALGKPSVLIPSPNVTNNHQEYNARALSDIGAAITIKECDFNADSLKKALYGIIYDEDNADTMSRLSRKLGITDACEKIYEEMKKLTAHK